MDAGAIIALSGILLPIVVIILILLWIRSGNKKLKVFADELKIRKQNAVPMNAKIIESSVGVQGGEIKRIVFLKFEILNSHKPYTAEAAWFVDTFSFSKAQAGEVIAVKVDRDDPYKIYPDVPWAVYTEGYDKSFSVKNLEGS